jgi:hypothetical protein
MYYIVYLLCKVTCCNTPHAFCFPFAQKLIGSPDDSSLGFLRSDNARRYLRQLPQFGKQNFSAKFPHIAAEPLDLLEKMLIFDPDKRITGITCSLYKRKVKWKIY